MPKILRVVKTFLASSCIASMLIYIVGWLNGRLEFSWLSVGSFTALPLALLALYLSERRV